MDPGLFEKHLVKKHKMAFNLDKSEFVVPPIKKTKITAQQVTLEPTTTKVIADYLVSKGLSFNHVNSEHFHALCEYLHPGIRVPHGNTVRDFIIDSGNSSIKTLLSNIREFYG